VQPRPRHRGGEIRTADVSSGSTPDARRDAFQRPLTLRRSLPRLNAEGQLRAETRDSSSARFSHFSCAVHCAVVISNRSSKSGSSLGSADLQQLSFEPYPAHFFQRGNDGGN
jgi:hypothetical protein